MHISELKEQVGDGQAVGDDMMALAELLYPICRSITGKGFRATLTALKQHIPLEVHEVATGTAVFDWTVPKEWNIRDAYVKNEHGERVIDFQESNLHVVNYSAPVNARMSLEELRPHLHTIPEHPDWIPYRTSYYKETWGFCVSQNALEAMKPGTYEVCIDSSIEDGHLTYGECVLPGKEEDEILISCHACHPSLANDNLSGIGVATMLAKHLQKVNRRYTYRFVFIPGTIGSITWLSRNEEVTPRIKHGLVVANVGDAGCFHYKKSRRGNAEIDQAVGHVLAQSGQEHIVTEFSPYGYDERQYCTPGFNLPVGSLTRTPFAQYPEYHTSADNLDFIGAEALAESFLTYLSVFEVLEGNATYQNLNPKCEPQLGKRGLYRAIAGARGDRTPEMAMLWVLNLSDGDHSLLDIALRSGIAFSAISKAAEALLQHDLLEPVSKSPRSPESNAEGNG